MLINKMTDWQKTTNISINSDLIKLMNSKPQTRLHTTRKDNAFKLPNTLFCLCAKAKLYKFKFRGTGLKRTSSARQS